MIIRDMTLDDVDRVSQLEEEAFSMPWHRESFIEMINNKDALYMVADDNGKVVGTCGIITAVGEGDISNVVVDKEYRNKGVGELLVSEVMKKAADTLNVAEYTLEVRVSNASAIRLYEKLGFVSEGIRPRFYEKPTEDAMIMWKR